jgi:predicted transcriptional regulator
MNKQEFSAKVNKLINELEVQGDENKFYDYYEALETVVYYVDTEIKDMRNWLKENTELRANTVEAEGYLRGLLYVKDIIQVQECSKAIYRIMESE